MCLAAVRTGIVKQRKPHLGFRIWGLVSNVRAILSIAKLFMDHSKAEDGNQWRFMEALSVCFSLARVQLIVRFSVVRNRGDFKHIYGFFLT